MSALPSALLQRVAMRLPLELEASYHRLDSYPENLVPSGTAIYRSKLASYRQQLDDNQRNLFLIDGEDDVEDIFEIPILDLETAEGKGQLAILLSI
jgi:hypothetical protein